MLQDTVLAGRPNVETTDEIFEDPNVDIEEKARSVIDRLGTLAEDQVIARNHIETRWLENLRAYHGFYDPQVEADLKAANQSRAFIKITGAKTRALVARLYDLIFPTDDRNWSIGPTPVPKLSRELTEAEDMAKAAAEAANIAEGSGDAFAVEAAVEQGNDQAQRAKSAREIIDKMNKAGKLMQEEMDDQLVESLYPQECRKLITDAGKLGTGILKGPVVHTAARGNWLFDKESQQWRMDTDEELRPRIKRVDPWSFFPDMSAQCIAEAEFTFERYLWSKKELRRMVKTHGFSANAVRNLLREEKIISTGVASGLTYIAQLRSISKDEAAPIKGRYVGWEYHGPLECAEVAILLRAMGQPEAADEYEQRADPLDEMNVVAFFCEGELLKIAPEYPLDSGETLYSVFNVVDAEACIFGYGVPHLMDSTQAALNAAWRMGLDNSAYSVKPQIAFDKEHIMPADGDWNMAPGKMWLRVKGGTAQDGKVPIEFFNVPNNMQEIMTIIRLCMEFADIESGVPMPQQGEQGAHTTQTVGGMAILQNASNIVFRAIVKNFDDGIITPTMRRLYDWNMQFNEREDIKGDMQVDARGTSVLLVKEVQAANLMVIITGLMANPVFAAMIKPYEAITKLFQSMMIKPDDLLIGEEQYMELMQQQAEAEAAAAEQQQDPAIITAQARIESAQIQAASRKASDENQVVIEQIRQRTALISLAEQTNMTLEELNTRLNLKTIEQEGKERMMAAEIGAEQAIAEAARANGEVPKGSGGYVSGGSDTTKVDSVMAEG